MKKILGLDLGTNSIGWALVDHDINTKEGNISGMGSRIIPMSQDVFDNFGKGQSHSQTAERTHYRGVRRMYQRDNQRRERLHRVLQILQFLPQHYSEAIDFDKYLGQFKELSVGEKEVKLNYRKNDEGKYEFIFMDSFNEMLAEFKRNRHEKRIPYDWTIYFLRKKALVEKISKEELAWVILNFNQKRGYYQLRGEENEKDESKREEFINQKVVGVEGTTEANAKGVWYEVRLENGWIYRRQSLEPLDAWIGKYKQFIVTTQIEKDGTLKMTKEGEVHRTFRNVDSEKDWIAIKAKTEREIEESNETVGEYIYKTLLKDPSQKIRGKLVRTIERKFYKAELATILKKQIEFHSELQDSDLYRACIFELYPRNEAHINNIKDRGFFYLFIDDIIFYQRPLKSKKSTIGACDFEFRTYMKNEIYTNDKGEKDEIRKVVKEGLKVVPKSHPLFQEFRLRQFMSNLRIYNIQGKEDLDVTTEILRNEECWDELYEFLNSKKEIEQKHVIDFLVRKGLINKQEKKDFRWNYVTEKKYPGNVTRSEISSRLAKVEGIMPDFLTHEIEIHLWHIIYSVKEKDEFEKALITFSKKYNLDAVSFVENFKKFPPFQNEYGSFSLKAIKKLLPLMRHGKYWSIDNIDITTKARIERIINGEVDEKISNLVREKALRLESIDDFCGLPTWFACYIVYGRHSESSTNEKWNSPEDIDKYLNEFRQHSLRNPIVEQVVTETLRVIRDIWHIYGNGKTNFFNEIHIELGRELKNPASKRKEISDRNIENEITNSRIRELLKELMNDDKVQGDVRPYSPSHQEILKIYEEGVYYNERDTDFEIEKIRKNLSPSGSEIRKYKLWLEQGYVSPYTRSVIPLSRLFTEEYQVEHIIPQARYFDDSLSNKIICESEVNSLKSSKTAYEFIKDAGGTIVELSAGKSVKILSLVEYEAHCNEYFRKNRTKLKKLLTEEIPEGFIERQMNDSRYISKFVKSLLNRILRDEDEAGQISAKLVPVTGAITNKLKQDWGLNDKWNEIIAPRFKRLNEITKSNDFGFYDEKIKAFRCEVPDSLKRGFSKKRIDHRHHALDALVIACVDRRHINYLNALNSERENYALRDVLLVKSKKGDYTKTMLLPWHSFPNDALLALQATIVSFKQNNRVINKTNNKTWQWIERKGKFKKELIPQTKGDNWAIRKPLHKETVSGKVSIRIRKTVSFSNGIKDWKNLVDQVLKSSIKTMFSQGKNEKEILKYFKEIPYLKDGLLVEKLQVYSYTKDATASRIMLTDKFTRKQLESVTDSGIKKILENHLKSYLDEEGLEKFELAFSPDGIDELNKNIVELNNGVKHKPIYKVRIFEEGSKFNVGYRNFKDTKYVEAAKGTNLFFSIYLGEDGNRKYETVPLNEVIEHQIQEAQLPSKVRTRVPVKTELGTYLFSLSPNDLVYVPDQEEIENPHLVDFNKLNSSQVERIYKMVSSSGSQCFFLKSEVAVSIANKFEYSSLNKTERSVLGEMIKERCWKIKIDRVGKIVNVIQ